MKRFGTLLAAGALGIAGCQSPAYASGVVYDAPAAERASQESGGMKRAIFAGGCFWGVEAVFSHMKGVESAVSGYHGGVEATATYSRVSAGGTNHAEAVMVIYDPNVVRYDQLLQVFFAIVADPTLRNRQGPDVGSQYRAALVPLSDEQRAVAQSYLEQMRESGVWSEPIVTEIEEPRQFYRAETYHQDFAEKNPRHPYIVRWDAPMVDALESKFPALYRSEFKTG